MTYAMNFTPTMFVVLISFAIGLFLFQKIIKKRVTRTQYDYLRDLALVSGFFLILIWFGGPLSRFILAAAISALCLGTLRQKNRSPYLRLIFLAIGVAFYIWGPKISFLGLPNGQYLFLSAVPSILLTALWVAVFPVLIEELDHIPGMSGHLLAVTFSLCLAVTFFSGQDLSEAFLVAFSALLLLAVFWSRHGHMYRQLGLPLSAFWGIIVAGTSLLGVSKGITFSTLLILPLGLFAIPMLETSLHFASLALSLQPRGARKLYRGLIQKGVDHPSAVHLITVLCFAIGAVISIFQLADPAIALMISFGLILSISFLVYPVIANIRTYTAQNRKPGLWGIPVDNISMDYAVAKMRSSLKQEKGPFMVVTLNALAAYLSRKDPEYASIASEASLCLPDGWGVVWALKMLGSSVQERVTGIDFMEHACRAASIEGWPVFLLGGSEKVVAEAALKLEEKYPSLKIAGYHSGYFTEIDEDNIVNEIRKSRARIIFAGMGVPKQEQWLARNLPRLGAVAGIGVGGSFDVISGSLKRAPLFLQKIGCEWLFRLVQEPWRFRRDLDLFSFILLVLATRVGIIHDRRK